MKKFWKLFKDILEVVIASLAIVFIITKFIAMPVQVLQTSMVPTLMPKWRGFSSVISRNNLDRFDIVIVQSEDKLIVKRLIGLPNEKVEYKDNSLYINDQLVDEPYLNDVVTNDFQTVLNEDEYFVMGDNRGVSKDSRVTGPYHKEDIKAKGIFVFYPFDQIGIK